VNTSRATAFRVHYPQNCRKTFIFNNHRSHNQFGYEGAGVRGSTDIQSHKSLHAIPTLLRFVLKVVDIQWCFNCKHVVEWSLIWCTIHHADRLVIQCTILGGKLPTAAEAVANLNRLIGPTNARRRRRRAPASLYYLVDIYNQTLNPIRIVNWTGEIPSCLVCYE